MLLETMDHDGYGIDRYSDWSDNLRTIGHT
jgi:hypothetical protein